MIIWTNWTEVISNLIILIIALFVVLLFLSLRKDK